MLRLATLLLALGLTRIAFAEPTAATITLQPVIPFLAGASCYELGGAANYYVNRSFSGWHAGAEAFWLWGETSGYLFDQQSSSPSQSHQGMSSPERVVGWTF